MGFINISDYQPIEPVPGCRMRTPFGQNMMLSYLEMDDGAEVPLHSHPHEQGGMLIRGTLELTIGDETRLCQPGSMFLIPPNVKHRIATSRRSSDLSWILFPSILETRVTKVGEPRIMVCCRKASVWTPTHAGFRQYHDVQPTSGVFGTA
ncbi:MAG: cupin 2 barrel domain-containing protein [Planctomycetota bacterium]|nr:MAG: cupin 2 barrel domain-containing protein [Planctomycetota bacterium]